ncbi:unnamed protein product [Protopolystoma xenopodis]|uniref:Uncharacterized protein n=1 Tax=Protopolystoma xenopodis TaxID=117903 RepID=A0A448X0S9_9PLAT|nr:unnamed protein product [Protopolystoma xenopodis]
MILHRFRKQLISNLQQLGFDPDSILNPTTSASSGSNDQGNQPRKGVNESDPHNASFDLSSNASNRPLLDPPELIGSARPNAALIGGIDPVRTSVARLHQKNPVVPSAAGGLTLAGNCIGGGLGTSRLDFRN